MPMLGFLYENAVCLLDEFWEGNVAPAFGQKEFYLQCKQRMPRGKRVGYYRGDSASYQAGLFNQLEEDGVKYGITVDQDKAVKSAIALILEGDWEEPVQECAVFLLCCCEQLVGGGENKLFVCSCAFIALLT
jgi:hypothetical protein